MENLELVNPEKFGLEKKEALNLTTGLNPTLEKKENLREEYNALIGLEVTEDNTDQFRALRLELRDTRTKGVNIWHKSSKEMFLAGGRFVDSVKNYHNQDIEAMESSLLEKEKHFENLEKERIEKLNKERVDAVSPFLIDVDLETLFLADMDEDVFEAYLQTKERNYKAIKEAEAKEEAERLEKIEAEKKEQERIRKENAKLKAEAEAKAKAEKIEAEKRAEAEAKRQAELDKERRAKELEIEKERQAKAKLEKELADKKAKEKAEEEAKAKAIEAERLAKIEAEKAPIKTKLNVWISSLELSSAPVDNDTTKEIIEKFNSYKKWAKGQVNKM